MEKGSKTFKSGSRRSLEKQLDYSENEGEDSTSAKQISITVTAEWIENLDVCKVKEIVLKMEFKGTILAVSDPILIKKSKVDIDLTGAIMVEDNVSLQFLDDMLSNPVLFTVTSSGPSIISPTTTSSRLDKEKKKPGKNPESPTTAVKSTASGNNVLGMSNLDISGLILGKKTVRECLPVDSDKKIPPMDVVPQVKLPKLWVNATTKDWDVFNEAAKKMNNILGITIESIYNIPEYIPENTVFEASVQTPSLGNKNNIVVFPGGVVAMPKEADASKRWLNLAAQFEGSGARSKNCVLPTMFDVINTLEDDRTLEKYTNKPRPVLQWNMWKSSCMTKTDTIYFYSKLIKYRVWPVEIRSANKPKEQVQKSAKSEKKAKPIPSVTSTNPDHFTAFINLSALLYPGVKKTRVATQLYTYSPSDFYTKFGAEPQGSISQQSAGTFKSKAPSEKSKVSVREYEENKDGGSPVFAEDGSPVFIIVEVELLEPLTPKQNPELLLKALKDYVSLKGEPRKKTTNMESTEENFSNSVKDMVSVLSQEYEKFCHEINENSQKQDDFDVGFEEFLCQSENFYKMQATLENKMVDLISEKFGSMSQCDELSDIYVYLVEKIHKITNECVLKQENSSSIFNIDDYQLYAEEALEEEEYDLAKGYLLMKLSHQISNPDYWLDCAVLFNIFGETEQAIEAVREALYLNFSHQMGLLLYALLMEKIHEQKAAEIAFHALLSKYPDYLEGWLAFWLYNEATGNTPGGFVALQTAKQLNRELSLCPKEHNICEEKCDETTQPENGEYENEKSEEEGHIETEKENCIQTFPPENKYLTGYNKYGIGSYRNGQTLTDPISWTSRFSPPNCIYIRMAVFMMRLGFYEHASMCLTQCMYPCTNLEKTIPQYHYYAAVNKYLLGHYHDAIPHLRNFVQEYGKDCFVWSLMGHCYYKLQNHVNAIACYEYVIESFNRPDDIHLIYLRMGFYYLKAKKYSCAKKVLLLACKFSPSPKLWKFLGIACLRMSEAEEAETAFSEANYLDNRDPETWAYLALTNSLLGRINLFKNCFAEAKKRNLQNQELIQEVQTCALLNGLEDEEFNIVNYLKKCNV